MNIPIYAFKTASRPALRRSHHLNRQINVPKRQQQQQQHTNTNTNANTNTKKPTAEHQAPKAEDESAAENSVVPVPNTVAIVPLWQRLGPLTRAFSAYGRCQRKRPLLTQFISSLVIYFCGDLSAQRIAGDEYDPTRSLRALVISSGSSIPSYKWFLFLNNNFNYASKALSLLTKVVVNQIIFTPIFNSYFFGMQSLLSGDTPAAVIERIKRTVPTSFINSCKLWPAVTAFSFTFIDPQYRSIFAGFVAIGWQTYLSYLNRQAEDAGTVGRLEVLEME